MSLYTYYYKALADGTFPCAFIDLDRLDENAQAIAQRAGNLPVRIASKSIRSGAILQRILAISPKFQGIMCYSAQEAVYLWKRYNLNNFLIAYPTLQIAVLEQLAQAAAAGMEVCLMVDLPEHIQAAEQAARKFNIVLPVCMDIDMSSDFGFVYFGVRRSAIQNAEAALHLWKQIAPSQNVYLKGVMGYEAQIAGVQDTGVGIKGKVIQQLKSRSLKELIARRSNIVAQLKQAGATLDFVNGGGTGSLEDTQTDPSVTELTAGSGFYASTLFDKYKGFRHKPAAGFALEICRKPTKDIYTCGGGGYVASGSAGPEKLPSVWLPEGATLLTNEGAGEVQTPVQYKGDLALGAPIFFRHAKAGELCERFKELHLIQNGKIINTVTTYRGDGQCFM